MRSFTLADVEDVEDPTEALEKLLEWPSIASKNWVYRQYDHMVRANTMVQDGRLADVHRLWSDVLARGLHGDWVETGTYKGGTSLLAALQ